MSPLGGSYPSPQGGVLLGTPNGRGLPRRIPAQLCLERGSFADRPMRPPGVILPDPLPRGGFPRLIGPGESRGAG